MPFIPSSEVDLQATWPNTVLCGTGRGDSLLHLLRSRSYHKAITVPMLELPDP
jgi:hypothetical protein